MDLLSEGVSFLADTMKAKVSRKIIYRRGPLSVVIQATIGRHPFAIEGTSQQMIEQVGRDYLFLKADLLLPELTTPERGDVIEDTVDEKNYEVMNPTEGEPEWRYNDSREIQIRAHTKLVS